MSNPKTQQTEVMPFFARFLNVSEEKAQAPGPNSRTTYKYPSDQEDW